MATVEEFDPNDELLSLEGVPHHQGISETPYHNTSLSPGEAFIRTAKIFAPAGVGLIFIMFGLTSTGSYYTSASHFGGVLAEVFYGWQAGTFLAIIGTILIYDAVKRSGYL